jgi:bifunctional non-homologous end joining protein LigD
LKRFPDGVDGKSFYNKNAPSYTSKWVKTFPVPRRTGGPGIRCILINDHATLAWTANTAALELHPFLHRAPQIETPTCVVFDLDPGPGADLLTCIEIALLLREHFAQHRLQCWAKVSGSKGLQLYLPLNTPVTYAATKTFARTTAEHIAQQRPDLATSVMSKSRRSGKVFIDWSQNWDFKTTVGVYSLRAKRERRSSPCL